MTAKILQAPTPLTGTPGIYPNFKYMVTADNLATLTTAGYLNDIDLAVYPVTTNDVLQVMYSYNAVTQTGTYEPFTVSIDHAGIITLTQAVFAGEVALPTITNHLIVSTNVGGGLANLSGTAINAGSLQAGLSGTAGTLISYPGTASKGSLVLAAVANTGNTVTTISNAAMGQASVISIPDPAAATANFAVAPSALVSGNLIKASGTAGLVADAGTAVHSGTTTTYAGGGTSNAFTVTGMAATWVVVASNLTSTNSVSITKVVPTANTLTITWSADPGAGTTVNWIAFTAAV